MMNFRAMTGASTLFTPDDIPSLEAWYDASDVTTITKDGSGLVSNWADKSGNGYDATATGSARPTIDATTQNGRDVIDFDGSNTYLILPSGTYTIPEDDNTIFVVSKQTTSGSTQRLLTAANVSSSSRLAVLYHSTSKARYVNNTSFTAVEAAITPTDFSLISSYRDNTTQSVSVNSGTPATDSAGADTASITKFYIGASGALTEYLDGSIAEIVIYSSALSEANISAVDSYLIAKWGL